MADAPPAAPAKGGGTFGFLGHKLFGKIPVWVVAVAGVGGYYWYTHYGPGKKSTTGTQTDPAGNTCAAVNPATGYCPGTPEDAAALAGASTSGTDTSGAAAGAGNGAAGGAGGTGGTAPGGTGATGDTTGTAPPPDTTGTPPPVVQPAAPPPPGHLDAHQAHVAHEQHLAEERADRAQAAHKAHIAHTEHLAHLKKKGAKT